MIWFLLLFFNTTVTAFCGMAFVVSVVRGRPWWEPQGFLLLVAVGLCLVLDCRNQIAAQAAESMYHE